MAATFGQFQANFRFSGALGATIRIGREMLCLPYAGFFKHYILFIISSTITFRLGPMNLPDNLACYLR